MIWGRYCVGTLVAVMRWHAMRHLDIVYTVDSHRFVVLCVMTIKLILCWIYCVRVVCSCSLRLVCCANQKFFMLVLRTMASRPARSRAVAGANAAVSSALAPCLSQRKEPVAEVSLPPAPTWKARPLNSPRHARIDAALFGIPSLMLRAVPLLASPCPSSGKTKMNGWQAFRRRK